MLNSLRPHGLYNVRLVYSPLFPGVCSNSCPLSWWCSLTISLSTAPFSFCLHFFPASGSFPVSQLFTSGGLSIEAPASASVLPRNIHRWFPLGLTGLISLLSRGLSKVFSSTITGKTSVLQCSAFFMVQLSHACMSQRKQEKNTRG